MLKLHANHRKASFIFSLFFWVFIALFIAVQLFSLTTSPLPWFDETLFASIARHWSQTGKLVPQVAIFTEVKLYGPVYFWLTGSIFKLFGFGIVSFRLVSLLAGIGCVWVGSLIFKKLYLHCEPQGRWIKWGQKCWWLLLFTDPLYTLVMHEGRMDLLALLFALGSIYVVLPVLLQASFVLPLRKAVVAGVLLALAALTTPRACFIFVTLTIMLFWQWRKQWRNLLGWGISILLIYSTWIYTAFNGLQDFANAYLGQSKVINASLVGWFVGGVGYVPRQSYLLVGVTILAAVFTLIKKPRRLFIPLILVMLGGIGLFYVLVRDYGQYSVFILPFYYLFIFQGLSLQPVQWRNWLVYPFALLLMFNLAYFSLKNIQVMASLGQRQPHQVTQFVQKHIPKGARVIGEPMYFYAVLQAGSNYQYMDLYETLETREARQRIRYKYEYLIITDHLRWRKPKVVQYYLQNSKLKQIARFEVPASALSQKIARLGLLSGVEDKGYNCIIYKREVF